MDKDNVVPVGAFVIISFLLIGLVVMGCMLYWNWSHRKQRLAETAELNNGNACIYEKNNPRTYNRSSKCINQESIFACNFLTSIQIFTANRYIKIAASYLNRLFSPALLCTFN